VSKGIEIKFNLPDPSKKGFRLDWFSDGLKARGDCVR
jgi:hypothetical protein